MSNRVFDNSENRNVIQGFNKNAQQQHKQHKQQLLNQNSKLKQDFKKRPIQTFARVPLGGKDQNSNSISLNRSKSSLTSTKFNPPRLTKSNSSLGIPAVSVLQDDVAISAPVSSSSASASASTSSLPSTSSTRVPATSFAHTHVPILTEKSKKRVLLEALPEHLNMASPKRAKEENFTDSLMKLEVPEKPPVGKGHPLVFSLQTDKLHARHVIDRNVNNMDPMKRDLLNNKSRNDIIDELVELHWRDPIETIPEQRPGLVEEREEIYPTLFDELELQFFSTPNMVNEGDYKDEYEDKYGSGDLTIDVDYEDDIGLNDEDLRNLLD